MVSEPHSFWQRVRKPLEIIGIIAVCIGVVVLIVVVIRSYGTGFEGYDKVSTTHTISGPSSGTVTRTEEYQPGKTLWDWLQLLFVPVVLAIGGFWLNQIQKDREQRTTEQHAELERELTRNNQEETLLQVYIDKMSELLLKEHLGELKLEYQEVRRIARVRTLTVLPRLNAIRKRSVLQFLYESSLIDKDKRIIDLQGADITGADLFEANLSGANLREAYLSNAELIGANLSKADLSGASLSKANLVGADLSGADLGGASLIESNLGIANLREANLKEANLREALLDGAFLNEANLNGADLNKADLRGADLREANLHGANLHGADLSGANLSRAILLHAQVSWEQLKRVTLIGAISPDGEKL